MLTQVASLIVCLFLTQIFADSGVQFVMDRNPNNYFCGNLKCVSDITDSGNDVFSFVDMSIYDITRFNSELKVASVSIFQSYVYVDTTKSSALSCTGVISRHQANLTVQLRHDIDCLYGVFKCQLNVVTVSGHPDEVTKIVTPEYNQSFSRISDVSTHVDRLAVMLDDQSVRANFQTTEIKRLADIVDNKILPLIEQTAHVCNSSDPERTPDLNGTEAEMEKPAVKPESVKNLSVTTDKIPTTSGVTEDVISPTTNDLSVHSNIASIHPVRDLTHLQRNSALKLSPHLRYYLKTLNAACYPGSLRYGDFCYSFSQKKASWLGALDQCTSFGATLAEIVSKDINDLVVEQMKARNMQSAWIGGKRRNSDKQTLEWVSTGREINGYTNWNMDVPYFLSYGCIGIWTGLDYKWITQPCTYYEGFICELRVKV